MITDPLGANSLTTAIRRTADLLSNQDEEQSGELWLKYTQSLCCAVAYYDGLRTHGEWDYQNVLHRLGLKGRINDCKIDDLADIFAATALIDDLSILKRLLAAGTGINARSLCFKYALLEAARRGDQETITLLLDRGADANAGAYLYTLRTGIPGRTTALQAAAIAGHGHVVRFLLESKYNVSTSGDAYEGAILCAARGKHQDLMQYLIEAGHVAVLSPLRERILIEATKVRHLPIALSMADLGADLNYAENSCGSALYIAISRCDEEFVQLLLAKGASPDGLGVHDLLSPLYCAVYQRHRGIAELLLDHGADINAGRETPLYAAAKSGVFETVRLLLERGAALDTDHQEGYLVLAIAAEKGYEPIVRLLVEYGADVGGADANPNPAMVKAIVHGHRDVVDTLI